MSDLISRAALLKECAECQKIDPYFEGRGWANHFIDDAGEPSTEWYCVEDMIENAPTIDAIPVEWLEKRRQNLILAAMVHSTVYGDNSVELCHAVNIVLDMWQQEQEAQDG